MKGFDYLYGQNWVDQFQKERENQGWVRIYETTTQDVTFNLDLVLHSRRYIVPQSVWKIRHDETRGLSHYMLQR